MKKLTVFTPTYNRAHLLTNCYNSLVCQNNKDFVWQIIDDGSNDNTEEVVNSFIAENRIPISYYKKENGGKASAINLSLSITETPFWLCLDSDDFLLEDAVEKMLAACEEIENDDAVCGAITVRSDSNGNPMKNKTFPLGLEYATQTEIRYKYNVPPEYAQIYKTEVVKKFPFPLYNGEHFITESWAQDQIDTSYVFKIFREPVMVCEYLPTGLTNNYYSLIRKNPLGFLDFYSQRTEICKLFKPRLVAGIMYNALYALQKKNKPLKKKNFIIFITTIPGKLFSHKLSRG